MNNLFCSGEKTETLAALTSDTTLFDHNNPWEANLRGEIVFVASYEDAKALHLKLVISEAQESVKAYASNLKRQFSENADMEDLASWPELISIAKSIVAGTASTDDVEIFDVECRKRGDGLTVEQLSAAVLSNRKTYMVSLATIKGMTANAVRMLSAAKNVEEVRVMLGFLEKQAVLEVPTLMADS